MSLTSVIRYIRAQDTSSSTGVGKTGLAFGDFTAKYLTQAGTLTSLTTETITTLGTYQAPTSAAHIRIKELANTDPSKGIYEVHFHNTQMADSGQKLWLFLSATGAAIPPLEVELLPFKADLLQILGTTLTETSAGYLAAAFKKLFNVAAPVLTSASVNQTGDSYARIGANGASLTSLAPASTALSTAQWTNARAGYLDNINNAALATTVAQTGDSYAIVSNATYGNSALKSFFFQAIVSYGGHR